MRGGCSVTSSTLVSAHSFTPGWSCHHSGVWANHEDHDRHETECLALSSPSVRMNMWQKKKRKRKRPRSEPCRTPQQQKNCGPSGLFLSPAFNPVSGCLIRLRFDQPVHLRGWTTWPTTKWTSEVWWRCRTLRYVSQSLAQDGRRSGPWQWGNPHRVNKMTHSDFYHLIVVDAPYSAPTSPPFMPHSWASNIQTGSSPARRHTFKLVNVAKGGAARMGLGYPGLKVSRVDRPYLPWPPAWLPGNHGFWGGTALFRFT